jgi:SAM-dependent methyltransferase
VSPLRERKTAYRTVGIHTGDIDQAMTAAPGERPWQNPTLTQSQDVRGWIADPESIDERIRPNLQRFASLLKPGARVLDVGCFGGYAAGFLASRVPGLEYVGVDILEEVVAAAAQASQVPGAVFEVGDLFDLGPTVARHGPFDAALCLRVVIHLPHLDRSLGQLLAAAPLALVGLRVGPDEAIERLDTVSGERHFFRRFSLRTIEASLPEGASYELHADGSYDSLVLRRA